VIRAGEFVVVATEYQTERCICGIEFGKSTGWAAATKRLWADQDQGAAGIHIAGQFRDAQCGFLPRRVCSPTPALDRATPSNSLPPPIKFSASKPSSNTLDAMEEFVSVSRAIGRSAGLLAGAQ